MDIVTAERHRDVRPRDDGVGVEDESDRRGLPAKERREEGRRTRSVHEHLASSRGGEIGSYTWLHCYSYLHYTAIVMRLPRAIISRA